MSIGLVLLKAKVSNVGWMGGEYPRSGSGTQLPKGEWNMAHNGDPFVGSSTYSTMRAWPGSVRRAFSGWNVGNEILTGAVLTNGSSSANPCRAGYIDRQGPSTDRQSWDPATVLLAVRGLGSFWSTHATGYNNVSDTGINRWEDDGVPHNQSYIVAREGSPRSVAAAIDELLLRSPSSNDL